MNSPGSGDVYSFGQGAFGALGHDSKEDVTVPQLVGALWGLGIVQVRLLELRGVLDVLGLSEKIQGWSMFSFLKRYGTF